MVFLITLKKEINLITSQNFIHLLNLIKTKIIKRNMLEINKIWKELTNNKKIEIISICIKTLINDNLKNL